MKKLVATMMVVACVGLTACSSKADEAKFARHVVTVAQPAAVSVQKLTKFRDMTWKKQPIPVVYRGRCKILPTR